MAIEVRHACEDELDAASAVIAAAFEPYRQQLSPAELAKFEPYLAGVVDVRSRRAATELFVAVDAGRVIGAGALYPPDQRFAYARDVGCEPWAPGWAGLRTLAVDPAHRGHGTARLIVEARVRRARELGAVAVALHTGGPFAVSRDLYRRLGWERAPAFDMYPVPEVCAEAYVLALLP